MDIRARGLVVVLGMLAACGGGGGDSGDGGGVAADAADCGFEACEFGEGCAATGCAPLPHLRVRAFEDWFDGQVLNNDFGMSGWVPAPLVSPQVVGVVGTCTIYASSGNGGYTSACLDVGLVTFEALDQQWHLGLSGPWGCTNGNYGGNLFSSQRSFFGGEIIRVSSPGGGDIGTFDGEVVVPPPLEVTENPPFSQGVATTLTWTPGDSGDLHFGVGNETRTAVCVAPDADGTFTVPAAVTSQLVGVGEMVATRLGSTRIEASTGHAVELSYQRNDVHFAGF